VSKIVPMSRSEWLHKMGTKEAQLRALREQRAAASEANPPFRGHERASLAGPLVDPTVRGEGTGISLGKVGGDPSPCEGRVIERLTGDAASDGPRGETLPVRPRGRPLKSLGYKPAEPWKECDPPVSRRTWFRRKKR
jgi:hypothetical protein